MTQDHGAPSGTGSRASHEAEVSPSSSPKASIPSADDVAEGVKAIRQWIESSHNSEPFLANIYDHELRSMVEVVLSCPRGEGG